MRRDQTFRRRRRLRAADGTLEPGPLARRFLDWLALPNGLSWLDVGCGNGGVHRNRDRAMRARGEITGD